MPSRCQIADRKLPVAVDGCAAMDNSVVRSRDLVVCDMHFVGHDRIERIGSGRLIGGGLPRAHSHSLPIVCDARRRGVSGSRLRFGAIWKSKPSNRVLCEAGRGANAFVEFGKRIVESDPTLVRLAPSIWCRMACHRMTAPCRGHVVGMRCLENNPTFAGEISKFSDRYSSYGW